MYVRLDVRVIADTMIITSEMRSWRRMSVVTDVGVVSGFASRGSLMYNWSLFRCTEIDYSDEMEDC